MTPKIFLHHQRCGGNTLRYAYNAYGIPFRYDDVSHRIIHNTPKYMLFEIEPGIYVPKLDGDYEYFTVIREPIERVISLVEIRSRPDENSNTFECPSYEHRATDEFWQHVHRHMTNGISAQGWHYANAYTRSMYGTMLDDPTDETFEVVRERLMNMPTLLFNKATFRDDLEVFMRRLNIPQRSEPEQHRAGKDGFTELVPDWFRKFVTDINSYDIALYNELKTKVDEHNIMGV